MGSCAIGVLSRSGKTRRYAKEIRYVKGEGFCIKARKRQTPRFYLSYLAALKILSQRADKRSTDRYFLEDFPDG